MFPILSLVFLLPAVLVGHVTLRLLKPACDLDEAWEQEDLDAAALRTIVLLHNHTVPQREIKTSGEQTGPSSSCFLVNHSLNIWAMYQRIET